MKKKYYTDEDLLYIQLTPNPKGEVKTDSFKTEFIEFGLINLDFDEENKIVGFEIQSASKFLSKEFLDSL